MTAPDRPGTPDGRSTPETAGQAAYEAFAKAIPEDVFPEHLRDMGWTDWGDLRDHERPAWEAAAQAAIAAAAPAPAAPLVLSETDLGALVNAGQEHDYAHRSPNRNWTRVPDHQAARLILGAIAKLREQPQAAPETDETLSEHVTIRFPADMIAAAKQIAAAEGMTVSAWIRREVEREAGRREQAAPELAAAMAETRALRELAAEILAVIPHPVGDAASQRKIAEWRKRAGLPAASRADGYGLASAGQPGTEGQ